MIKRMWDFYLSPKMGWIIYASFAGFLFPAGAAWGATFVFWVLCMDLAAIRSVLLLFMKEKQEVSRWWRGVWIGLGWGLLFLMLLMLFGDSAFVLWTFPVSAWTDLEGLMFVR